ncbi:T9SS type A sorting domain-containing protein [Mangrovimonas spongiae]|uniref:T9SS C-terminal target domain-containing protein n=1 Tax=Mangrovimonas spongiae TaxID=2494697 RepID=A0A428JVV2_9FLAO|nr:T9SS type A sorting domain-containing protein [Mangrovimonas spongiae]RSK38283.1 T9SS C-terminal target domain-containing protein [Mangrovimonas spongiae]
MKKITFYLFALFALAFSWQGMAQSVINITTSGGSWQTEKWVNITTEPDGAGTQVWGQGNGTQCDGAGLINEDINIAPGVYYVNCYDQYDDSWDGTLISVTAYGNVLGDNGGVSPDDGEDTDLNSDCEGTPEELEASFMITVPTPPCATAVVDSSTVVDDCGNSNEFSVDVVVSTVGDGTVVSDGTNTFPIIAGTVTAGPYTVGDTVTLTVQHSDSACDFPLGDFESDCPQIVTCGTPINTTYCYLDNDDTTWTFTSSDGSSLRVDFIEGYFEDCCDDIIIYDGADTSAAVLFMSDTNYGNDATGISAIATGDTITVRIDSDGSVSCDAGSGSPALNFDVTCSTCAPAVATTTIVEDCGASTFTIDVAVSDLGDATTITDGTTPQPIAASMTFGPYATGTDVTLDVVHSDAECDYTLGTYTYVCPPANDDCSGAETLTVNTDYGCGTVTSGTVSGATDSGIDNCGGTEDDDVWYSFVATNAAHRVSLINISGSTTDMYHAVYDATSGCGALGAALECNDGNTTDLTGLTPGNTYYVQVFTWTSTAGQDSAFDVCIGTPPPPPANDLPSGAITLTLDEGTACGANTITGISNESTTDSGEGDPSCSSQWSPSAGNGDLWYQFTAPSADLSLNITNIVGMFSVSGVLYSGVPGSLVEVGTCGNGWPKDYTGLTIGETYYLRVWDYGNDDIGTFDLCGYYLSCTTGEASASVTDDCGSSTFTIDVDVTSLGDITHVNDGTTSYPVVAGVNTLPTTYNFGDSITLTAEHSDSNCDFEIGTYTEGVCPPVCGGNFYDTGGDSSSYSNDENYTVTICPDVAGDAVTVTFNSFLVEGDGDGDCYDALYIYDGSDNTGTPITPQSLGLNPGATSTGFCWQEAADGTADLTGEAITATNPSGCLTFTFTSDGSVTFDGWDASVSCATMSVDNFSSDALFTYYPNPVNNMLSLKAQSNISNVSVYNMLGQEVIRTAPNTVSNDVNMSELQAGAYFVKVTVNGTTETIRIIKK